MDYIQNTPADTADMLKSVGVKSIDIAFEGEVAKLDGHQPGAPCRCHSPLALRASTTSLGM